MCVVRPQLRSRVVVRRAGSFAFLLALGFLSVVESTRAQSGSPDSYFSGTMEVGTPVPEGDGADFNAMIRGDSPFDNVRLRLFFDVAITPKLSLFNQVLLDPTSTILIESFVRSYLRYTLIENKKTDLLLQAGKIPTPFGTFAERAYAERNPLVGTPLMYHYFSSLRNHQLPASNADLLSHQGQGQVGDFTGFAGGGSPIPRSGLPMIYDNCWDVGVEVLGSVGRFEYLVAVTQGTLSTPQFKGGDDNSGKQLATHLRYVASPSLVLGASYAFGPYLNESVEGLVEARGFDLEDFEQEVFGLDLEYSFGHFQLIAEYADNSWESPTITDGQGRLSPLESEGFYVEAKYAFLPGLYGAARYGEVTFGHIDDGSGTGTVAPWDAAVERLELGMGYRFNDWLMGKVIWQDNRRAAPAEFNESFLGLQLVTSF